MSNVPKLELETDSREYDVLWHAATASGIVAAPSLEIGVRSGGSSELILRASDVARSTRAHIALDPWGRLPYAMGRHHSPDGGYSDEMRRDASASLYRIARELTLDIFIYAMKDTDFYQQAESLGIFLYRARTREDITEYSLVHVDGEHTVDAVRPALEFFAPKVPAGGYIVVDDVDCFDFFPTLEPLLLAHNYVRDDAPFDVARPHPIKVSYRKKS